MLQFAWLGRYWAESLLTGIGLTALAVTCSRPGTSTAPEPAFQGQPLSFWMAQLAQHQSAEAAQAVRTLGPAALKHLLHTVQGDPWSDLGAVKALQLLGQEARPTLLKAMHDPSDTVRLNALRAIGRLPLEDWDWSVLLPRLRRSLIDLNGEIVFEALSQLETSGTAAQDAIPELISVLQRPPLEEDGLSDAIRQRSATLLGDFGPYAEPAVPALKTLLSDSLPCTRQRAALALWHITHDPTVVWPELTRMLESPTLAPRRLAALAFAQIRRDLPLSSPLADQVDSILATMTVASSRAAVPGEL